MKVHATRVVLGLLGACTLTGCGKSLCEPRCGDGAPAWSPDGKRIAFERDDGTELRAIYVVEAGGGTPIRLTDSEFSIRSPSWSPDGKRIAFLAYVPDNYSEYVVVTNAAGTGTERLGSTGLQDEPSFLWSPDGRRIAYSSDDRDLHIVGSDGSGDHRLLGADTVSFDWAPDGTKLVFSRAADGELDLVSADGTRRRRLTQALRRGVRPDWSPDGKGILFSHGGALYFVRADGSALRRLPARVDDPPVFEWSPDGTKIAWVRHFKLHVMNADGTGRRQLGGIEVFSFSWSPDGRKIAVDDAAEGEHDVYILMVATATRRKLT